MKKNKNKKENANVIATYLERSAKNNITTPDSLKDYINKKKKNTKCRHGKMKKTKKRRKKKKNKKEPEVGKTLLH